MEGKLILLVTLVLLVLQIQPVHCPQEPVSSPFNNSTQVSNLNEDPCQNRTIVCSAMVSSKNMFVPWFSFAVSSVILLSPFLRLKDLMPDPPTGPQTLFCWSLYLGLWGYIFWICYLHKCFHPSYSAFPVLLTCGFGCIIHVILSVRATAKTSAVGDQRPTWIVPLTILFTVGGVVFKDKQVIGWIGVALSVLSHFFRIASTEYYARINWYLFSASIVGSMNGFLWLIHPQLCISREYKNYLFISFDGVTPTSWRTMSSLVI